MEKKQPRLRDGISRAERRVLSRAGIDVLITNSSFKQPDVLDTAQPPPSQQQQRRVYFSTEVLDRTRSPGESCPSITQLTQSVGSIGEAGGINLDPGYIRDGHEMDGDDNTDSYDKVRKIIFDQAIQYNVTKLEQKNVNFTDIVDINDQNALETRVTEDIAAGFGEGDVFRVFMLVVIIANSIMIGLQTDGDWSEQYSDVFYILDYSFLAIFVMEILFKWFYGFFQFWKSGWNVFDVVIVLFSILGSHIPILSDTRVLRILRVLRAFRTLRSITILNGLQVVVQTIIDSIPDMLNIILLLLVIMFIWAVVGVTLFGTILPEAYGDLQSSMFTLFVMITQIGWLEDFDLLEEAGQFTAAAIYYTSFMIIGVFIFVKIIVAVVVSNLEEAYANRSREQMENKRALKSAKNSTQGQKKYRRSLRNMPTADDPVWKNQIPYEIPDFDKISKAKVENYLLVLNILEENLKEFAALKNRLREIQTEVKRVNTTAHPEEDDLLELDDEELKVEDEGDALSRWMKAKA
ncbi:Cation channel sperm-associated protein 4 [Podochytrium sp. JEL0797]|nr:Cation channel sperm-associated protein 4 [Podochytrium sp. JEL0797]